ncbi:MAG: glycosyltransferase family 9 protein, partial [Desulfobacterales bacterium]
MPPRKKIKYRLEYLGLWALYGLLRRVPLDSGLRWCGCLGRLLYAMDQKHRRRALINLRHAFPEHSESHHHRTLKAVFANLCRVALEFAHLDRCDGEFVRRRVTVKGREHLESALARGKGMIGVLGHLGNWELAGAILVQLGYPLDAVYHSMRNPYSDRYINAIRRRAGIGLINMRRALWLSAKALKKNHALGLIADQDAGHGGVFIDFFGRAASTAPGPALFAMKMGAPLVFCALIRNPGGRYTLHFRPPFKIRRSDDFDADLAHNTKLWSDELERWVRAYPEQWFWVHRRWHRRPLEEQPTPLPALLSPACPGKGRVLVVRFSSLGDVTLVLPVVERLHREGYQVEVLTKAAYRELFSPNPHIADLLLLENFSGLPHLIRELQRRQYYRIVDLHKNIRSLVIRCALPRQTLSYKNYRLKRFLLVKARINLLKHNSVIRNYFNTLKPLGIHPEPQDLTYTLDYRRDPDEVPPAQRPPIVISPFARYFTKEWVYYDQLIETLSRSYPIVILGEAQDAPKAQAWVNNGVTNLCGKLGLAAIVDLIARSALLITNDSGIMHLGAGTDTPLISFFGSTVPEFGFVPRRSAVSIVQDPTLKCRPCHYHGRHACPLG